MRIERSLQPNHSEYMRLVATLTEEKKAQVVHTELVRHLEELFSRGDKFSCAGFGRSFETRKEFREWKKNKWDPIADERCTLSVEKRDGRICVSGDYGLVLDDWSREELAIALDGTVIALRVYTAGYGLDHVEEWLTARGASVHISVEGEEYGYRSLDDAVAEVKAQAGKERHGGVRAKDSHHAPV
jgi:hypothetical protein